MKKEVKNWPASIHQRLKNLAAQEGRTFQDLFYEYAMGRFLFRMAASQHSNSFILKGGLMFKGWGIPLRRLTRDIDVQGYQENSVEHLAAVVKEICSQDVEPDGMRFDPDSVRGERIMNEADYPGIRIYFTGYLGMAPIYLHLDVSFANVVTPSVITVEYRSLLDLPVFEIRGYPYETAISEKLEAMVKLDFINDRMKDFFDIWLLSQEVEIQGSTLASAIRATFENRRTPLPASIPAALTGEFAALKQTDWEIFLTRSNLNALDYPSLNEVISTLRDFLWPVVLAAANDTSSPGTWNAGGPWAPA